MTNYLELGAQLLQDRMESYAGVPVTYKRGNEFSFQIVAVPGRNPVDIIDREGIVLRGQVQDFTVKITTLRSGMTTDPRYPRRGDEIIMTVAGIRVVFLVNGEDFATSHYEPSDSYGVAWRVHTKSDRILDA